jgi:hypothetical protein
VLPTHQCVNNSDRSLLSLVAGGSTIRCHCRHMCSRGRGALPSQLCGRDGDLRLALRRAQDLLALTCSLPPPPIAASRRTICASASVSVCASVCVSVCVHLGVSVSVCTCASVSVRASARVCTSDAHSFANASTMTIDSASGITKIAADREAIDTTSAFNIDGRRAAPVTAPTVTTLISDTGARNAIPRGCAAGRGSLLRESSRAYKVCDRAGVG